MTLLVGLSDALLAAFCVLSRLALCAALFPAVCAVLLPVYARDSEPQIYSQMAAGLAAWVASSVAVPTVLLLATILAGYLVAVWIVPVVHAIELLVAAEALLAVVTPSGLLVAAGAVPVVAPLGLLVAVGPADLVAVAIEPLVVCVGPLLFVVAGLLVPVCAL